MQLDELGFDWLYEPDGFIWKPTPQVYTPDFRIKKKDGSYMYVETKGYFKYDARCKMADVRKQHPDLDLRLVFYDTNKRLAKSVKSMSYAEWAEKYGYMWSSFCMPQEWRKECYESNATAKVVQVLSRR